MQQHVGGSAEVIIQYVMLQASTILARLIASKLSLLPKT